MYSPTSYLRKATALCALIAGLALSVPEAAHAGTAASTMAVSATVISVCTIAAGPLAFLNYDPIVTNLTTPLDAQATVTIVCALGNSTTTDIDQGANSSGTTPNFIRRLKHATLAQFLTYQVYRDSARTLIWGTTSGTPSGSTNPFTGTGVAGTLTAYGRIAGGQLANTGAYADTLTATITF